MDDWETCANCDDRNDIDCKLQLCGQIRYEAEAQLAKAKKKDTKRCADCMKNCPGCQKLSKAQALILRLKAAALCSKDRRLYCTYRIWLNKNESGFTFVPPKSGPPDIARPSDPRYDPAWEDEPLEKPARPDAVQNCPRDGAPCVAVNMANEAKKPARPDAALYKPLAPLSGVLRKRGRSK